VGASAELPSDLDLARRAIENLYGEVPIIGHWAPSADERVGRWQLLLELAPSGLGDVFPIAPQTRWYALVDHEYPQGRIDLFPAKDGGVSETFPHQERNDPGDPGVPWRDGKLCLVDTITGHQLATARYDPATAAERLAWHIWRALEWLRAASRGELIQPGEPFELPVFGQRQILGHMVVFREGPDTLDLWPGTPHVGLVDLVALESPEGAPISAATVFRDLRGREVFRPAWGTWVGKGRREATGLWFRFNDLVVRPPWRAPQTWREIGEVATEQGFDLGLDLELAASAIRDGLDHDVLVGFPIPARMGQAAVQMQWVALRLPALNNTRSRTAYNGFRAQNAGFVADRVVGVLAPEARLAWIRTENWHPDELAARGRFEGGLAGRRVLLLGAGALGATLGALAVRGGVVDIDIVDREALEAGNLVRHELDLRSVGALKAEALAARLSALSPNANVTGHAAAFPGLDGALADAAVRADLVIDTTGSDAAIDALADYAWPTPKLFVSASLSYGAERLYLYLAAGQRFPGEDFRTAIRPWIERDARLPEEFPWAGTGCWNSVFPARADDVALLAAVAVRQIDQRLAVEVDAPVLLVFERLEDGTVRRAREDTPGT
jgi:hypothetical protein